MKHVFFAFLESFALPSFCIGQAGSPEATCVQALPWCINLSMSKDKNPERVSSSILSLKNHPLRVDLKLGASSNFKYLNESSSPQLYMSRMDQNECECEKIVVIQKKNATYIPPVTLTSPLPTQKAFPPSKRRTRLPSCFGKSPKPMRQAGDAMEGIGWAFWLNANLIRPPASH